MNDIFPTIEWTNLLIIPGILVGYTAHELGHAVIAYLLGDTSQVARGKVTLNPLEHISWFGTLFFVLFGFGWPRPVQANPEMFKHKYRDMLFVAIAGPLTSFTFGLLSFLVSLTFVAIIVHQSQVTTEMGFSFVTPSYPFLSATPADSSDIPNIQAWSLAFTGYLAWANFVLAFISMMPLPGQDGFTVLLSLLAILRTRLDKRIASISTSKSSMEKPYQPSPDPNDSLVRAAQLERRNKVADIHFKMGVAYHEEKKYDDAIARYRQAIQSDKNFGPAYINMGLAYLGKDEQQKAIHAFRGATRFADDSESEVEAQLQLQLLTASGEGEKTGEFQQVFSYMNPGEPMDASLRINWFNLLLNMSFILLGAILLYGLLIIELIQRLSEV